MLCMNRMELPPLLSSKRPKGKVGCNLLLSETVAAFVQQVVHHFETLP